jgi:hypothetical protein
LFDLLLEYQGNIDEDDWDDFEPFQELDLDEWISTEELLSGEHAFTYEDLHAMLENRNTVARLTPHAAISRGGGRAVVAWLQLENELWQFRFSADGQQIIAFARSSEHLLEICDIVLRFLEVSVVQSVKLDDCSRHDLFINAPILACLMEQCQSLRVLKLVDLEMDEDHCRVLGSCSRPGLEIVLDECRFTSAGASSLAEVLGCNQGPTKLDCCYIDNSVLAGLLGNSRLNRLRPKISSSPEDGNRDVFAIVGALKENKGLVELHLIDSFGMSDESWDAVCFSLKTHPTLEVLDLQSMQSGVYALAVAVLKYRIQALLEMMKTNMSIRTLRVDRSLTNNNVYRESVIPYLETNQLRPRVRAIQKTGPIPYRVKVLGQALLAVRTDPNHFWMLLSGNAEVALP